MIVHHLSGAVVAVIVW